MRRAIIYGIQPEARRLGEIYFQGLFAGLGYRWNLKKWNRKMQGN